jgi:hypothetical protein
MYVLVLLLHYVVINQNPPEGVTGYDYKIITNNQYVQIKQEENNFICKSIYVEIRS